MSDQTERALSPRDSFFDLDPWRPWPSDMQNLLRDWPQRFAEAGSLPTPSVDITEADDQYRVRAELPGVEKDDVSVELENGVLELRGEKKTRRDEKLEKGRCLECTYGAFSRSFTLPQDADPDRIEAQFKDGVLEISIAKQPGAKAQQIAVKG